MRVRRLAALIVWAGLIFLISSLPNPPGQTGQEWQSYLAHVTEYAVLSILAARALCAFATGMAIETAIAMAWLLSLAYGISDEWHQSFVPNRDSSALDVLADATGAAAGLAAWQIARRFGSRV